MAIVKIVLEWFLWLGNPVRLEVGILHTICRLAWLQFESQLLEFGMSFVFLSGYLLSH